MIDYCAVENLNKLITISIPIISLCQYKCFYCYDKHNQKHNVDLKYINKINNILTSKYFRILLLGGEPTLHLNLRKIIDILESNNNIKIIELYTNNEFIPKNLLRKSNKLIVYCSYHPTEANLDKFIDNVLIYKKYFNVVVQVNMLPKYKKQIDYLVNKLKDIVQIQPNYLYKMINNKEILIDQFYNKSINDYLENLKIFNGLTYSQCLNKSFKNYKCYLNSYDLDNFTLTQNCTFDKIDLNSNPLYFKELNLNDNIVLCKYDKCLSPCYMDIIKENPCKIKQF